jgi:hypothetical protein
MSGTARRWSMLAGAALVAPVLLSSPALGEGGSPSPSGAAPITTLASGLDNPRGFDWSPDGALVSALAGTGGDEHIAVADGFTVDIGLTSSIVTVAGGCTTPVARGLVSGLWEEAGWIWGAMDVTYLGGDLYALLSGAGPSFMSPSSFSGVFRVNGDGTMTLVADVTNWLPQHKPAVVAPDWGSDGSLFDMEAAGDALLVSDAVSGLILRVTTDGAISTVVDLSEGHPVPTGIAVDGDGNAFVGFETAGPYGDGQSKVVKITPDGAVSDVWTGLTVVTDVAFGPDGALYAAEMATGFKADDPSMPPDSGRVVRQDGMTGIVPVVTDLPYPVHIGFGADGRLVVATPAFGADGGRGLGSLVSVDISDVPVSFAGFTPSMADCPQG